MKILMSEVLRSFNALRAEIDGLYHEAAQLLDLSDSSFVILYSLAQNGEGCTPVEIYKNFGLSRQTVHSSIKSLIRQGIIEVRKGEGRERRIFLTGEGREIVNNRVRRVIEMENRILSAWTDEERRLLLYLYQKYRDEFREELKNIKDFAKDSASG